MKILKSLHYFENFCFIMYLLLFALSLFVLKSTLIAIYIASSVSLLLFVRMIIERKLNSLWKEKEHIDFGYNF